MRNRVPTLFLCLALTAAADGARAQETPENRSTTAPQWYVGTTYGYQSFFNDIDAWQIGSVSIGHKTSAGSVIARANYANRFGNQGYQGEIDAYPRLTEGVYAYLNIGYSQSSSVFPEWRSGAEIFASLPDAYEASVGYRQLRFGGPPVTLFTGAVGKYSGNYWFSLRPYVRSKDSGLSASGSLLARRYYEDGDHYIGARIGFGSTPSDQLAPDQTQLRTSSFTGGIQGSTSVAPSVLGTWSVVFDHEELSSTRTRKSVSLDLGARLLF